MNKNTGYTKGICSEKNTRNNKNHMRNNKKKINRICINNMQKVNEKSKQITDTP